MSAGDPRPADARLLREVVAIPSVTGSEQEAVRALQAQARRDGFRVAEDAAGNFIAETGSGPRLLLFVGHVDTVPGHIPVREEAGVLWGRGTVDAKGPLVAAYCAARRHLGSPDLRIRIVGAVDEEGDSRGAKALDRTERPDFILVGEPSGVHGVTLGYKGILRASFTLERPKGHGAHPGPTAVEQALVLWADVAASFDLADRFDALQGHLLSLTTESDGLTDRVKGRFQLRLPPGSDADTILAGLQLLARRHGAEVHGHERMQPHVADKRTPLVAAFLQAIRAHGGEPRLLRKTGTADLNHLAVWFPGVPIAAYGPGDASLDHTPEERIALAEFHAAVDILDQVFARLRSLPAAAAAVPAAVPPAK